MTLSVRLSVCLKVACVAACIETTKSTNVNIYHYVETMQVDNRV